MSADTVVPSLLKGMRVVSHLAGEPGCTTAQLGRALGIAPASCFRIVHTLQAQRWIRVSATGGWELAGGLMPVIDGLQRDRNLIALVRPHLDTLVRRSGLSAKCSIREDDQQSIILSQNANRPFTVNGPAGASFCITSGSSGAALLMDAPDLESLLSGMASCEPEDSPQLLQQRQDDIRRQGWCGKIGVHPQGIDGISAPVRDGAGRVCCALTLLGLRGDMTEATLPELGRALRDCVAGCQLAITHHQDTAR